ncbi:MAG: hypothetical protein EOP61_16730 [Sphingomonadales bacterium]|nr:MAG: hypothetical protein EOP61_16730 [Sphingomonadales bacterium]
MDRHAGSSEKSGARLWLLRWPAIALFACAAVLPLLFTAIPPLIDLPGHLGRYAIQAAGPESPLRGYFDYRWALSLNLGVDLAVEALRHVFGLVGALWVVVAATTALTVLGLFLIARAGNPQGAFALTWALPFVHGFAFRQGFVNFSLGAALSLLGFALWLHLARRPGLRAALILPIAPLLLVVHAVGGGLLIVLIGGREAWLAWRARDWRLVLAAGPLAPAIAFAAAFLLFGNSSGGATRWVLERKLDGLMMPVRDQFIFLDIGTVLLTAAVLITGWRAGARMREPGAVIAMALLFVATPAVLSGVAHVDSRLVPVLAMLALALLDWRNVMPGLRWGVMIAGLALFAVRLVVTTTAFAGYGASYASETAALDHVARGSRVLALTQVECGLAGWREARLDHVSNLASVYRDAWVNSHWAAEGVQLLQVRYRPSQDYYVDPSEFVWPERCVDKAKAFEARARHTLAESLPRLPIDRVDYLWLIGTRLPAGFADPRLALIWSNGTSALFAVRAPVPNSPSRP